MYRALLRQAAAYGIAMSCGIAALAQEGGIGVGPTAAPATAPAAAPAPIVVPPVQTPTITNQAAPQRSAPAKPAARAEEPARAAEAQGVDRNEFQDFIAQSTGQTLPLYGYNLFQRAPSTFAPVENIPVTPDYLIGPGDQILIRAWGQIDVDYRALVDRSGTINIPRVGVVPVAGIRYQNLTEHVRSAISRN